MAKQFLGTRYQSFKDDGTVNAAGWVYFYEAGTSTEKTTYSDSDLGTANASPVVLNSAGAADIWYDGDADVSVYDSTGTLIDSYPSINPATSSSTSESNLITNGSFEDGGSTTPSNWTRSTPPALGTSTQDSDSAHGLYSWKFTSGGNGAGNLITTDFFNVAVGRVFNVMWQMKSSVADVRNLVEVVWYDDADAELSASSLYDDSATNPTSWTTKSALATPVASAVRAKLRLTGCHSSDATSGSTWFDGVLVTESPSVVHTLVETHTGAETFVTLALSGALSSTKTTAAGYTRIGPNLCMLTAPATSGTSLTRDAVTNIASPGSGAVALIIDIFVRASTANGIATRYTTVNCYSDAGATVYLASVACTAREEAAVAATTLMEVQQRLILPVASPYLQMVDDAGNQGYATYQVIGYYD